MTSYFYDAPDNAGKASQTERLKRNRQGRPPLFFPHSFLLGMTFWLSLLLSVATSYSTPNSSGPPVHRVVVVGGVHGNEYTGVWCIKAIEAQRRAMESKFPSLQISTLLANPQAHLENKRFIDTDLNREFSREKLEVGSEGLPNTIESLRAQEINLLLGPKFNEDGQYGTDLILDLHSTTSNMGITLIIPEGDALMAQAAAYVMWKCSTSSSNVDDNGEPVAVRCLMHVQPDRQHRPNLSSAAKHGFTIEVGPVPQGVLRHDAVEKTQLAMHALLEFFQRTHEHSNNQEDEDGTKALHQELVQGPYPDKLVPCFRSAPAVRPGEMSGKITWPCHADNPNFPACLVHKSLQDRDFHLLRTGDALFVNMDGSIIPYNGSHGDAVYLIFVNEGGYYYKSSGTGIGVAVASQFSLETGRFVENDQHKEGVEGSSPLTNMAAADNVAAMGRGGL